ncbi:hypothetical protein MKX08_007731 [Trichoderma sp. CBMAI-0020]|nr:hypothetical protein MKX08_007731 [Trichoderma sp. CBMAI-0020]
MPYKLLYLITLFTIRAITNNAFKAGYRLCKKVLYPRLLKKGNCVYFVAGSYKRKRLYILRMFLKDLIN